MNNVVKVVDENGSEFEKNNLNYSQLLILKAVPINTGAGECSFVYEYSISKGDNVSISYKFTIRRHSNVFQIITENFKGLPQNFNPDDINDIFSTFDGRIGIAIKDQLFISSSLFGDDLSKGVDFSVPKTNPTAESPINIQMTSDIKWVMQSRFFLMFTEEGIFGANLENSAFTYDNLVGNLRKICNIVTSDTIKPVILGSYTYFVSKDATVVYSYTYRYQSEQFIPNPLNDHVEMDKIINLEVDISEGRIYIMTEKTTYVLHQLTGNPEKPDHPFTTYQYSYLNNVAVSEKSGLYKVDNIGKLPFIGRELNDVSLIERNHYKKLGEVLQKGLDYFNSSSAKAYYDAVDTIVHNPTNKDNVIVRQSPDPSSTQYIFDKWKKADSVSVLYNMAINGNVQSHYKIKSRTQDGEGNSVTQTYTRMFNSKQVVFYQKFGEYPPHASSLLYEEILYHREFYPLMTGAIPPTGTNVGGGRIVDNIPRMNNIPPDQVAYYRVGRLPELQKVNNIMFLIPEAFSTDGFVRDIIKFPSNYTQSIAMNPAVLYSPDNRSVNISSQYIKRGISPTYDINIEDPYYINRFQSVAIRNKILDGTGRYFTGLNLITKDFLEDGLYELLERKYSQIDLKNIWWAINTEKTQIGFSESVCGLLICDYDILNDLTTDEKNALIKGTYVYILVKAIVPINTADSNYKARRTWKVLNQIPIIIHNEFFKERDRLLNPANNPINKPTYQYPFMRYAKRSAIPPLGTNPDRIPNFDINITPKYNIRDLFGNTLDEVDKWINETPNPVSILQNFLFKDTSLLLDYPKSDNDPTIVPSKMKQTIEAVNEYAKVGSVDGKLKADTLLNENFGWSAYSSKTVNYYGFIPDNYFASGSKTVNPFFLANISTDYIDSYGRIRYEYPVRSLESELDRLTNDTNILSTISSALATKITGLADETIKVKIGTDTKIYKDFGGITQIQDWYNIFTNSINYIVDKVKIKFSNTIDNYFSNLSANGIKFVGGDNEQRKYTVYFQLFSGALQYFNIIKNELYNTYETDVSTLNSDLKEMFILLLSVTDISINGTSKISIKNNKIFINGTEYTNIDISSFLNQYDSSMAQIEAIHNILSNLISTLSNIIMGSDGITISPVTNSLYSDFEKRALNLFEQENIRVDTIVDNVYIYLSNIEKIINVKNEKIILKSAFYIALKRGEFWTDNGNSDINLLPSSIKDFYDICDKEMNDDLNSVGTSYEDTLEQYKMYKSDTHEAGISIRYAEILNIFVYMLNTYRTYGNFSYTTKIWNDEIASLLTLMNPTSGTLGKDATDALKYDLKLNNSNNIYSKLKRWIRAYAVLSMIADNTIRIYDEQWKQNVIKSIKYLSVNNKCIRVDYNFADRGVYIYILSKDKDLQVDSDIEVSAVQPSDKTDNSKILPIYNKITLFKPMVPNDFQDISNNLITVKKVEVVAKTNADVKVFGQYSYEESIRVIYKSRYNINELSSYYDDLKEFNFTPYNFDKANNTISVHKISKDKFNIKNISRTCSIKNN